jgi:hypothetical protein
MKPLVLYCRWHEAKLRLHGRDETAVWGELVFAEESRPFHFKLQSWELTIGTGPTARHIQLDEMGVEVSG